MSVATGSQSSRPSKRFRSAGPEDSHLASSPVAPQTVPNKRALQLPGAAPIPKRPASRESTVSRSHTDSAPIAPMAPMAPMDSPTTAVLGSPVEEEISVSIEETATTTQTPAASLLGGLKNRFVGVLTGQKPAIASEAIIAGRKRSIDEVEDSVTAIVQDTPAQTRRVESPVVAATKGDDTAIELENQLHDASEPSDAQPNQETSSAPTASSPAPKSRSASTANEIVAVNGSKTDTNAGPAALSEPISIQDSAPPSRASIAAISKRKSLAKSSAPTAPEPAPKAKPAPRRQRARKSFTVTEGEAAVEETAAETAGPSLVAETSDEPNENGEFEVDRITDHRHNADDPTLLDVQVSWKTNKPDGEYTWEPEANVQEDAPDALFQYWRSVKGGRNSALKNPDMWHVLRIEKHQVAKSGDVSVYVAWIGSPQRSWEPENVVAGYASEHLDEYWETQGGRDIVLGAQSVSSAPKRRGRPPKSAASKAATAPASAKQVNAKATAKKQASVATSKRQQRGADEKKEAKAEAAPAPASGRTTRSSKR